MQALMSQRTFKRVKCYQKTFFCFEINDFEKMLKTLNNSNVYRIYFNDMFPLILGTI